eukprot:TRINITY_DN4550_c0_g2_i3.p1 TRINITY_DN4550_c0_g2~~TRINITY_DN4550_c0_g2_i3.p1  ORF type:complete len:134 (-),score=21.78 TRINITY_DN4550_c0_g2_i3:99-500(-)
MEKILSVATPGYRERLDKKGKTALHEAARYGTLKGVKLLLTNARDEYHEMKDYKGRTALQILLKHEHDEYPYGNEKEKIKFLMEYHYMRKCFSKMVEVLSIMDEEETFWGADAVVKECLGWMMMENLAIQTVQ